MIGLGNISPKNAIMQGDEEQRLTGLDDMGKLRGWARGIAGNLEHLTRVDEVGVDDSVGLGNLHPTDAIRGRNRTQCIP